MGSFAGISFHEIAAEGRVALAGRRAVVAITTIPGGNGDYIQLLGKTVRTLSISVRLSAAAYAALYGALDTSGTLDYGTACSTAILSDVSNGVQLAPTDHCYATLEFIIPADG